MRSRESHQVPGTRPGDGGPRGVAARAVRQRITTAPVLSRSELLGLPPSPPGVRRRVRIHRNVPVELVVRAWGPFAADAGLDLQVEVGPYDDSLSALGALAPDEGRVDVELVFVDPARYDDDLPPSELAAWLLGRLDALVQRSTAPVLVVDWAADGARAEAFNEALRAGSAQRAAVEVADLGRVRRDLPVPWTDERMASLTGGPAWSDAAVLSTARALASCWIPALVLPPVKAVVVDLDGTLYDGVLGEDGPGGLVLTPAHAGLQEDLRELRDAGVLLALASRNDPADVEALFAQRGDFPLRYEDFSQRRVSWGSKVDALTAIADGLRIAVDSLVLLDDNPGELAQVGAALPAVRTLHAADAAASRRALEHCPGLFRFRRTHEDAVRAADLAATGRRASLARDVPDREEYQRQLEIRLGFAVDRPGDLARLAELTQKTNQFNSSLDRRTVAELEHAHRCGRLRTVAVTLRDRISDSGTVAAVLAHHEDRRLVIEGICISCRALGREVEDLLVQQALVLLAQDCTRDVEVRFVRGPRNTPALEWLQRFAGGVEPPRRGGVVVPFDRDRVRRLLRSAPVRIVVEGEGG